MTKKLGTLIRRVMLVFGGEDVSETNRLPVDAGITDPLPISGSVTADTELSAAALLRDDLENPTITSVGSYNMGYDANADNWNRSRHGTVHNLHTGGGYDPNTGISIRLEGASGSVPVGPDNPLATIPYDEDGNDLGLYLDDILLAIESIDTKMDSFVRPSGWNTHYTIGVIVGTSAVSAITFPLENSPFAELYNHGPGIIYVGFSSAVTASGVTRGAPVYPGGCWRLTWQEFPGDGTEVYVIGDTANSTAYNVTKSYYEVSA